MQKAIQFIGTQRSGSNLLRVMLNQHPEISAPHPPHILQVMMPFLPMYGNLESPENFSQLVDDVCKLVELNPVNWGVQFDRNAIADKCASNSLPQVMKAIYEIKAEKSGATIWCCKSMASIHYIDSIEKSGINPFYIFIYRDGRDVACSFRKAVVGEKHVYHLAMQWKDEQEKSLALCEEVESVRYIKIPYEDFVIDPSVYLKQICSALGLRYESVMLDYASAEESKITAQSGRMWSNLVKPVMTDNSRKYLKELAREDLVIFESVAGDVLDRLGYPREIAATELKKFPEDEIANFTSENKVKQNAAKASAAEDMSKRKAQDDFILALRTRFNQFVAANEIIS